MMLADGNTTPWSDSSIYAWVLLVSILIEEPITACTNSTCCITGEYATNGDLATHIKI